MLFAKKERLTIEDKAIKKDLCAEDGTVLVRVNLRAPCIKCASRRDPLTRHAAPFYDSLLSTFSGYAEGELFKAAKSIQSADPAVFCPFAALMSWELTYSSENHISFLVDISVSNGVHSDRERRTQIWDRKYGQRCVFYDFFRPGAAEYIAVALSHDGNKKIDKELFVLRENGFEFFRRNNDGGYDSALLTHDELSKNEILQSDIKK